MGLSSHEREIDVRKGVRAKRERLTPGQPHCQLSLRALYLVRVYSWSYANAAVIESSRYMHPHRDLARLASVRVRASAYPRIAANSTYRKNPDGVVCEPHTALLTQLDG
jgi:hypothetical protein